MIVIAIDREDVSMVWRFVGKILFDFFFLFGCCLNNLLILSLSLLSVHLSVL